MTKATEELIQHIEDFMEDESGFVDYEAISDFIAEFKQLQQRNAELEMERDEWNRLCMFTVKFSEGCTITGTDLCIEWKGNIDTKGYGRISGHGGHIKAHRLSYCYASHKSLCDISDKVIRHTCDNPSCVNPKHLVEGTHADNVMDRSDRNRSAKGETNGNAKLDEQTVKDIRSFYQKGVRGRGSVSTAKRFGVCHSTVQRIVNGERWKHV